jgi:hypothetical protein
MASTLTWLESSVGTPKCGSCWKRRATSSHCGRLSDCPQLLRHLFAWMRRSISSHALNLMEAILSTCYKCTLSAVTHNLNAPGHKLMWTCFSCFGAWNSWHLLVTLWISKYFTKMSHYYPEHGGNVFVSTKTEGCHNTEENSNLCICVMLRNLLHLSSHNSDYEENYLLGCSSVEHIASTFREK